MAYTRHTWQSGEVISSALLNNIEDGIEEAASSGGSERFIIECTPDEENSTEKVKVYTHNVTLQEAYEAFTSGREVYAKLNQESDQGTEILYIHLNVVDYGNDIIMFTAAFHNPGAGLFEDDNLLIFAFSEDNKISMQSPSQPKPIIFNHEYNSKVSSSDGDTVTCNYTAFTNILILLSINPCNVVVIDHDLANTMPDRTNFGFLSYYVNGGSIVFSRIMSSDDHKIVEIQIRYNKDNTITYDRNILYEVQAN